MKRYTSAEINEFVSWPRFDQEVLLRKDPTWPRISIVTPSYNQGEFVERTILSVLNQNYPNLEYIVIDGGSTDGSVEIIRKYERYFGCWVSEPDKGQADAINKGFEKSAGEIMAWLNSDDMYLPGTLSAIADVFSNENTVDLVYGNGYYVDTLGRLFGDVRYTPFHFPTLLHSATMMQAATFWRRSLYEKAGGVNKAYRFCMDYDLFLRMAKNGKPRHTRRYLSCFRIHESQKTCTIAGIGKMEHEMIREDFLRNNSGRMLGWRGFWNCYCFIRRIFVYLLQGDSDYFFKGIYRRLTGRPYQGPAE